MHSSVLPANCFSTGLSFKVISSHGVLPLALTEGIYNLDVARLNNTGFISHLLEERFSVLSTGIPLR